MPFAWKVAVRSIIYPMVERVDLEYAKQIKYVNDTANEDKEVDVIPAVKLTT